MFHLLKIAPTPISDASFSMVKGFEKLGKANTGVVEIAFLRVRKVFSDVGLQWKLSFFSNSVSGLAKISIIFYEYVAITT